MRSEADYGNYGAGARRIAWALDLLLALAVGLPADAAAEAARSAPRRPSGERLPGAGEGRAGGPAPRILLIRPDHAGDLLMATPAIRALRSALPGARIEVLASPWGAPALEGNPDVDAVRTIDATWFEPARSTGPDPVRLLPQIAALRFERPRWDAAADLRGDFRSILLARVTGAPRRAGFSRLGCEQLLTDRVPFDPARNHVDRNHAVARLLGAGGLAARRPTFVIPDAARETAARAVSALPGGLPILALFPGTNRPDATWGASRFARAALAAARRRPLSLVLAGREADREDSARVRAQLGGKIGAVLDLAGKTSLQEAAALIERASAVLTNDSGAAHLAVACSRPVVAIFGPSSPALSWSWDEPERYAALAGPTSCARPCFANGCSDHGYGAIDPEEVARRLARWLEPAASGVLAPAGARARP